MVSILLVWIVILILFKSKRKVLYVLGVIAFFIVTVLLITHHSLSAHKLAGELFIINLLNLIFLIRKSDDSPI